MKFKNFFKILLATTIIVTSANALKKDEIKSQMSSKIDGVVSILEKKNLTTTQKGDEIIKIIDDVFDYELMAKISLGKDTWNSISPDEKKDFIKLFEKKLKNSYIEKLGLYNDQKVQVIDLKPHENNKNRLQLETKLFGKDKTYDINYNFYNKYKDSDEWLIYDVDLVGVSIIQTYRLQFAGYLKDKTFAQLLTSLK